MAEVVDALIYVLQLLGGALAAAGLWAWSEKDMFSNLKKLTEFPDPAFLLIIGGFVIFLIGFFGCVGALRENTLLLLVVSITTRCYNKIIK